MRIEVERLATDRLRRQVWLFRVSTDYGDDSPLRLRLELWHEQARPSPRHKWRDPQPRTEGWKNRHHNGIVHFGGFRRPAADVPFPDDVVAEAKARLMERIMVSGPFDPPDKR